MARLAPRPRRADGPAVTATASGLPPWLRHALRTALHLAYDAAAVTAAYRAAFWVRFDWPAFLTLVPLSGGAVTWVNYQGLLYAAVPIWLVLLHLNKLYTASWLSSADRFVQIFKACALGTLTTLVAAFLYERLAYSRLMLAVVFPISLVLLSVSQALTLWLDDWLARHEVAKPVLLVAGKDSVNRYQFAKEVARTFGLDASLIEPVTSKAFPGIAARPRNTTFVTTRMEKELGVPPVTLREGLTAMKAAMSTRA